MNLKEGTKLGRYGILSLIGAGGMGEVYRATDPKINRDVAIKVLPADFASNPERVERLEREAQAAGGLNHPNIVGIYDVDSQNGNYYVVSELLVGEELRDRLAEGPIPVRKTIDYAQQIVSGLAAAHERGIVHRDLKPENIFITKDDRVKILDFGLAKLREAPTDPHGSEDATKRALTDPGVVMGTVGYMSPEQVRGLPADGRSDIFSFGVILYEMLTGRRAFAGESVVETMHSILKADVEDIDDSGIRVSPAVEKLMRRCLEKNPDHRFHSAHDLGFALDAVASPTSSSSGMLTSAARSITDEPGKSGSGRWTGSLAWAAAAIFLLSTLVLAALYFTRSEPVTPATRFYLPPPEKQIYTEEFALSPDGRSIAFAAMGESGDMSLWVRSLSDLEARMLPGTGGARFPFWSPDGQSLGFFADSKLKRVDLAGGPAQALAEVSNDSRGGAWLRDNTIVYSPNTGSPLLKVSAAGGSAVEMTRLNPERSETSHRWPVLLPDGKHLLFFARGTDRSKQGVFVTGVDAIEPKLLFLSDLTAMYADLGGTGYLLFVRERTLMAQPFDVSTLTLSGAATPLINQVMSFPGEVGPTAYAAVSAAGGNLVYKTGDQQSTFFQWFDRSGKGLEKISEVGAYHEPSLSKDDTKVLFSGGDFGTQNVFMQDLVRGNRTRLTFDRESQASSVLSPDGTYVIYFSTRDGRNRIFRKSADGSGEEEQLLEDESPTWPTSLSSDGANLLFERNGGAVRKVDIWVMPLTGSREPYPYIQSEFEEGHAQFSPDGRWVAYSSNESGRAEVYIQSFPIGSGKWQVSTAGGDQVQWRADGKELYYVAPDRNLMAVSIGGGSPSLEVGKPEVLFAARIAGSGITDDRNQYSPSRDGQRFLVNTLAEATNFDPLVMVVNLSVEPN